LAAQPGYRPALRTKVICCVYLDRIDEARDWLARLLEVDPELTIARWRAAQSPYPPELLARYEDGLRKAGLPEE
jgi:hypothetical protein